MGVTSVRLQPDIEAPLEELAAKLDRSKNYLINQAIKEFIARQTLDEARWEDTLQALSSIKEGSSIPESEVNTWLGSWGTDEELTPPDS
jgi:predicted transcriptional regulator